MAARDELQKKSLVVNLEGLGAKTNWGKPPVMK
jgi:hypothetical protein